MKYSAHTLDEVRVRAYNEAAIVIGRLTQEATYRGNPMNVQMRTTLCLSASAGVTATGDSPLL